MIRRLLAPLLLNVFFFTSIEAQDFFGLSTGNYAGVSGVMLQPASIVDSRYRFDINLFSTGVTVNNNYLLLNRDAILKFNSKNFNDYQTFKSKYLSEAELGANEKVFFNIRNRTQVPLSFMASLGKKSAIALNIQSRSMIQGIDITQPFAKMAYNAFYYPALNNNVIDASGFSLNTLNWAEVGLTYGRVIYESDKHFFKAAFTGKYLAGVASLYMGSNDFRFSINSDSSVNFNTTNFNYQHNKNADFDLFDKHGFSPDANSFGWDAGVVYEFRRNIKNFKYIRNDDEKSYLENRRDVNKYIFRAGVSLVDVGLFKFDKPRNVGSFSGNVTNWNLPNANYNNIKEFDTALANRVTIDPRDPRNYKTHLPSALSVQFDLRFVKGFYLNATMYQPVSLGSGKGERFRNYGFYAFTPRWESRHVGVYIPYTIPQKNNFTDYKQNMLGATVRLGPVFFGSNNLGNMLFNKNLRGANVHVGFKIGITYGKPNKGSQLVERIFSKKSVAENDSLYSANIDKTQRAYNDRNRYRNDSNRLLIDYNKGQIFESSVDGRSIIIINNNYYGNAPAVSRADTALLQSMVVRRNDSLVIRRDSVLLQRNRAIADSSKHFADSLDAKRRQLDSLIQNMQRLRMQMESARQLSDTNATSGNLKQKSKTVSDTVAITKKQTPYAKDRQLLMDEKVLDTVNTNNRDVAYRDTSNGQTKNSNRDSSYSTFATISSERVNLVKEKHKADTLVRVGKNSDSSLAVLSKKKTGSLSDTAVFFNRKRTANAIYDTLTPNQKMAPIATPNQNNSATSDISRRPASAQRPVESNGPSQQRLPDWQAQLLRNYMNQSADLQNEIKRLQSNLSASNRGYRRRDTYNPSPVIVQPAPQFNSVAPPARQSRRDTIYIRDTLRINDTMRITKTDTVQAAAAPVSPMVVLPVLRDTIVQRKSVDYTQIPEDIFLFELGKSVVRSVYHGRLNYIANILSKQPNLKVLITGHTDISGPVSVNEALSKKRAENVAHYLLNRGVSPSRILVDAAASAEPAVPGGSKSASSQNRRVVVKFMH